MTQNVIPRPVTSSWLLAVIHPSVHEVSTHHFRRKNFSFDADKTIEASIAGDLLNQKLASYVILTTCVLVMAYLMQMWEESSLEKTPLDPQPVTEDLSKYTL